MKRTALPLACLLALSAVCAQAQTTPVTQLLNKLSTRYRTVETVRYSGTWTQKLGSKERSATVEFGMKRPSGYALELKGENLNTVVVADASFVTAMRPDKNAYTRTKAPAKLLGGDVLAKVDLPAPGAAVIALLLQGQLRDQTNKLAKALNAATLRDPIGFGSGAADVLSFRPDDVSEVRIYVSQQDGLIRRAVSYSGGKVDTTENYTTVEVDKPLPDGFLDRKVPEAARLVAVLPALDKPEIEIEFAVKNVNGGNISLADLKGKVVLVNFFFTTCGPCNDEYPHLVELYNKYRGKGLEVLSVNGTGEKAEDLVQFGKDYEATFPICQNNPTDLVRMFGISAYPTNVIFNRDGKIVKRMVGFDPEKTAAELEKALLAAGLE